MDAILTLLETANSLSPLAVIALLATIIYMLVKGKGEVAGKVDTIADNHLHDVNDSLRRIETVLYDMNEHLVWIRARINGK